MFYKPKADHTLIMLKKRQEPGLMDWHINKDGWREGLMDRLMAMID